MPRKRKRSHLKPSSIQRTKAPRRSPNPDEDNESSYFEGALCSRCAELEIPKVLPSLDSKKVCTQEVSSKVLQRLVFDSPEPYVSRPVAASALHATAYIRIGGSQFGFVLLASITLVWSPNLAIAIRIPSSRFGQGTSSADPWTNIVNNTCPRVIHARMAADQELQVQREIYTPRLKTSTWHS
jgi:hypothetical protein